MDSTRARVDADTPACPFRANDTAPLDTPARRAMSAIVGRFTVDPSPSSFRAAIGDAETVSLAER
jgi:hypothetical protein